MDRERWAMGVDSEHIFDARNGYQEQHQTPEYSYDAQRNQIQSDMQHSQYLQEVPQELGIRTSINSMGYQDQPAVVLQVPTTKQNEHGRSYDNTGQMGYHVGYSNQDPMEMEYHIENRNPEASRGFLDEERQDFAHHTTYLEDYNNDAPAYSSTYNSMEMESAQDFGAPESMTRLIDFGHTVNSFDSRPKDTGYLDESTLVSVHSKQRQGTTNLSVGYMHARHNTMNLLRFLRGNACSTATGVCNNAWLWS
eukprot:m.541509 g.541509  ORF g.541509 m.541509 type:complete len:251 (-) comp22109_c0_seq6:5138-5890(-)